MEATVTIENENDPKIKLEKFFMMKKFDLVPKIILAFVIELCIILVYFVQNISCRDELSGRTELYLWTALIAYFFYYSKLGYSFTVTFFGLVRDKKEDEPEVDQKEPKDEFFYIYALGVLTLNMGIYVGYYYKESRLYFYSIILYMHSTILMYHGWKMREFFSPPDEEEMKEMEEATNKEKIKAA